MFCVCFCPIDSIVSVHRFGALHVSVAQHLVVIIALSDWVSRSHTRAGLFSSLVFLFCPIFLLWCLPLFLSREGFDHSFPSSTLTSTCGSIQEEKRQREST